MKSALIFLIATLAIAHAAVNECRVSRGKKLVTFGRTREVIKFPCRYNAVRHTICGDWKVTISPGEMMEGYREKLYVIKSLWVGLEKVSSGRKWEGRTDLKIAQKYLDGLLDAPFNTKDGSLKLENIVEFSDPLEDGMIGIKNKDFEITLGLFDPSGRWHKDSTFSFKCKSNNFKPTDYPDQLCGNTTFNEVKKFKRSMEWRDNRQATLFFNVFTNTGIIQTDSNCLSAQRTMANKCQRGGKDFRYKAAQLCWPLTGKPAHQRCISGNLDSPISAFQHCVEFVCSEYKDKNACMALSDETDRCPPLPEVSNKIRAVCNPNLTSE